MGVALGYQTEGVFMFAEEYRREVCRLECCAHAASSIFQGALQLELGTMPIAVVSIIGRANPLQLGNRNMSLQFIVVRSINVLLRCRLLFHHQVSARHPQSTLHAGVLSTSSTQPHRW